MIKVVLVIAGILVFALLLYLGVSIWVSAEVAKIARYANDPNHSYEEVADQVSEVLFRRLDNTRITETEAQKYSIGAVEVNKRTYPLTVHDFFRAVSVYLYNYDYVGYDKDGNERRTGSKDIPVTVTLMREGWKWIIIATKEDP